MSGWFAKKTGRSGLICVERNDGHKRAQELVDSTKSVHRSDADIFELGINLCDVDSTHDCTVNECVRYLIDSFILEQSDDD